MKKNLGSIIYLLIVYCLILPSCKTSDGPNNSFILNSLETEEIETLQHNDMSIQFDQYDICLAQSSERTMASDIDFLNDGMNQEINQDNLEISVIVGNVSFNELDINAYEVYLDVHIKYSNISDETILVWIPKYVSRSYSPYTLDIEYKDEKENILLTQHISGDGPFPDREFYKLDPDESYCKIYTDYFLLSEQDYFMVDGEKIYLEHLYPGEYWVRVRYRDFSRIPAEVLVDSTWTRFEIGIPGK